MTEEEWYFAYTLQFGTRAVFHGNPEGEDEFFKQMAADLKVGSAIDCIISLQLTHNKLTASEVKEVQTKRHHLDYRRYQT